MKDETQFLWHLHDLIQRRGFYRCSWCLVGNNFGIRKLGTHISSLIGATVPILTVIFAGLMLRESLNITQIIGVILVTVGASSISWRKTPNQLQASK